MLACVKKPIMNIENPAVVADDDLLISVDIMKAKPSCKSLSN